MLRQVVERFLWEWEAVGGDVANGRFLLAVSGGVDSMVMLHVLRSLLPANRLMVAHVDHRLRPASAEDAAFVEQTVVSLNIPFMSQQIDVAALAQEQGWSVEEAGRKARYHFFAEVARQADITAVCVAHHADDQAETMLMNLLRGSGLRGLRGMMAVGRLAGAADVWLLRPLLTVTRIAIEAYSQDHTLPYRQDDSNQDTAYFRNRVRHELLPLLQQYNPQVGQHLQQTAVLLAADEAWLEALVAEQWESIMLARGVGWLHLRRAGWLALPLALRRRLLRRAIATLVPDGTEISFRTLEAARQLADTGETGGQVTLPAGLVLTMMYDALQFAFAGVDLAEDGPQITAVSPQRLSVPGVLPLANGWQLVASPLAQAPAEPFTQAKPWQAVVQLPASTPLWLRTRQPGERMQPLGMNGRSAKLKEIMINRKIPAASRSRWPLLATAEHPVWLVGHCLDERAKITAVDNPVIFLRCERSK